ncbi:MAG TPA: pyridoxal-phosphate dependent enzyme [Spirochaetota bacterium]|nr:pyridoxal-phosphate dependent enzyme [Spirochaetota bacterium]HOD14749.1 pyridoxal-phosphate dependent enzyme [Spirochaetota bacterium]HPG49900.1 pyridoxal-phosphate dependent enzyme [Spirochaetota bacterium]HPN11505.1 pyridoxal-phosphate dependent enzyme [Spirochaetota bacterium]
MNESENGRANASVPALFERYPGLEGSISRISLGDFPTPVQQLKGLGHCNLWVKRDDLSSPLYGGNKVRKLEYILGDVMRRGKREVVTIGGIGTNHGLATAIYCRRLGLDATLIVFDQPVTSFVRQNLLLFHKHGARLVYAKNITAAGARFYITERLRRPDAYFLYAGGSSPLGALGFVNAAFELKKQIDGGMVPSPRYIICPLGSNGTMAGLSLGMLLAGVPARVIGVGVTQARLGPLHLATAQTVRSLMRDTLRLLRRACPGVPEVKIGEQRVIHDYFGGEYGLPTAAGIDAMRLFREKEGIKLEPTYTAKACACLLDFIKEPACADDAVLYWHTYNSADLSGDAASVDYRELPPVFHRFFEGEPVA